MDKLYFGFLYPLILNLIMYVNPVHNISTGKNEEEFYLKIYI